MRRRSLSRCGSPRSCGLPSIEEYKHDYPKEHGAVMERQMTAKEVLMKYIIKNKLLWYLAIANIFVYFIRYGGATGLTGLMGYIIGSAFAGVYMGFVVDHFGWTGGFISLIVSCVLAIFFLFMTMGGKKAA